MRLKTTDVFGDAAYLTKKPDYALRVHLPALVTKRMQCVANCCEPAA